MGILDRMTRLLRANVNDALDRAEDPEKMLHELLREMGQEIRQARGRCVAGAARPSRTRRGAPRPRARRAGSCPRAAPAHPHRSVRRRPYSGGRARCYPRPPSLPLHSNTHT